MFTETVTDTRGETATGAVSEEQVLALLKRAAGRDSCTVEASRTGRVIVQREVWDVGIAPKLRTIVCDPVARIGAISPMMREDLDAIIARDAYLVTKAQGTFRVNTGRISAGLRGIPAVASQRLIDRGLVVLGGAYEATSNGYMPETRRPVRISLAARLVMLASDHQTRASAPAGYVRPADTGMTGTAGLNKPGRRAGMVYDRISRAGCSCGGWSGVFDGADEARRAARAHRQEAAAAMVRALP
ncbi:hypothetical protein OHA46_34080 (plasmid) [Streptomyces sp. NBC_00708]